MSHSPTIDWKQLTEPLPPVTGQQIEQCLSAVHPYEPSEAAVVLALTYMHQYCLQNNLPHNSPQQVLTPGALAAFAALVRTLPEGCPQEAGADTCCNLLPWLRNCLFDPAGGSLKAWVRAKHDRVQVWADTNGVEYESPRTRNKNAQLAHRLRRKALEGGDNSVELRHVRWVKEAHDAWILACRQRDEAVAQWKAYTLALRAEHRARKATPLAQLPEGAGLVPVASSGDGGAVGEQ